MFRSLRLLLATGNAHKAEEFSRMFREAGLSCEVVPATVVGGMPKVDEVAGTFAGNARLKAEALRRLAPADHWVLADDSGLSCDALGGAPGVDSAVYAGARATDAENRAKLLGALRGVPASARAARFTCHLVLLGPEGEDMEFTGHCEGSVLEAERGAGGFGYDALFVPKGQSRTFAEIPAGEKDALSHRAQAFAALATWIRLG
ncbi:MAG: RdgB/HAM1 family non-canonical purine NTP pyrophosphatase [Opitutia bacterium]|jgi:XTP/dITP diphosphohydrolase